MPTRGSIHWARIAGVVLIALLLGFQIARSAAVVDHEARPGLAAALWPTHPTTLTDRAFVSVAGAAARGEAVPPATRADIRQIAVKAPLAPDPYLIEGAMAEQAGRGQAAERLLIAARDRDPRTRGARFLLADRFIRTGRIAAGLIEMHALVSLQSRGLEAFEPAVAAYARAPGAVPQLKLFFADVPRMEATVLSILAANAANADLVLALASGRRAPGPDWRGTLVSALVDSGQYTRAYGTWARLSRVPPNRGLFNPAFAKVDAPAPFNWAFPQSSEGVAEPDGKGGLDVLYYGRAKAVLANQLLLLPAGRYRLAMAVEGAGGDGAVRWVLRCAKGDQQLADLPLRSGAIAASAIIPKTCEAQWLELQGLPGDSPQISELTIRGLRLMREAGQ